MTVHALHGRFTDAKPFAGVVKKIQILMAFDTGSVTRQWGGFRCVRRDRPITWDYQNSNAYQSNQQIQTDAFPFTHGYLLSKASPYLAKCRSLGWSRSSIGHNTNKARDDVESMFFQ
jgi:hypothetical protein